MQAYDGREVAPAAATENYLRWISDTDRTEPKPDARASGRSIGVPGILRMLQDVHAEHGKTAWRDLFHPAVTLADDGFDDQPAAGRADRRRRAAAAVGPGRAAYFLNPDGSPKTGGHAADQPGLRKDVGRHRHRRPRGVLHRRHRPRHRRRRGRHHGRPHARA